MLGGGGAIAKFVATLTASSIAALTLLAGNAAAGAIEPLAGCTANVLGPTDDGTTGAVTLPFTANFFGNRYTAVFVNNNGNVTFDGALDTYTPEAIGTSDTGPIIAPFWADVDTRGTGSNQVTYGTTTFAGRPTFCINWDGPRGVGYYSSHADKLNKFQLLLVDRSNVGQPGDFDIVFNYDQIQWETGDAYGGTAGLGADSARVGYSNGVAFALDTFELPGSGVSGYFLDTKVDTGLIRTSRNSSTLGRYVFEVRNGVPPTGGSISGTVTARSSSGAEVGGALVQVCGTACRTTVATSSSVPSPGVFFVGGLPDGTYTVRAFPPGGPNGAGLAPKTLPPVAIFGGEALAENIVLPAAVPPPAGTAIQPVRAGSGSIPVIFRSSDETLTTTGCPGATVTYTITGDGYSKSGSMAQGSPGTYTASISRFSLNQGPAHVAITIRCPDTTTQNVAFDIYVDPSGTVRDTNGNPLVGARVTLYRSDTGTAAFTAVPDGSGIMSPSNRDSDTTDAAGRFGWDVFAGYYIVRAEKSGCVDPDDGIIPYAQSPVLTIPPADTGVDLVLRCGTPTAVEVGSLSARRSQRSVAWRTPWLRAAAGFGLQRLIER